jgi:hypothetical protein
MNKISPVAGFLTKCALVCSAFLLISNFQSTAAPTHAWLSSLPLALAGVGFAVLQIWLRPTRGILLRRLLLAAAFILWAVDQLLPPGQLAMFIGDAVISAYVLDLYWMMKGEEEARRDSVD